MPCLVSSRVRNLRWCTQLEAMAGQRFERHCCLCTRDGWSVARATVLGHVQAKAANPSSETTPEFELEGESQ